MPKSQPNEPTTAESWQHNLCALGTAIVKQERRELEGREKLQRMHSLEKELASCVGGRFRITMENLDVDIRLVGLPKPGMFLFKREGNIASWTVSLKTQEILEQIRSGAFRASDANFIFDPASLDRVKVPPSRTRLVHMFRHVFATDKNEFEGKE